MNKFNPWKIQNGALQLLPWPDHQPGDVLVEVDVFEAFGGPVVDLDRDIVCHTLPPGVGSHNTDPWDYDDVVRDLFRHIDAHPQTTFHLRTLHPERVREVWPKNTNCVCPGSSLAPGAECDHHPSCPARGYHRENVTISLGPLATQADADRLADLCGSVELEAPATPGEG